nr:hypothetical protein [Tanacetum cinerariifolium]
MEASLITRSFIKPANRHLINTILLAKQQQPFTISRHTTLSTTSLFNPPSFHSIYTTPVSLNHVASIISDQNDTSFVWKFASNGEDRKPVVTVVVLGWLGSKQAHLRRCAEMYSMFGVNVITCAVSVEGTIGFDLGRTLESRVEALCDEIVEWAEGKEDDGRERLLMFHTFSNTGWLGYGYILNILQGRDELREKIIGCVVDSGGDPELNPKVLCSNPSLWVFDVVFSIQLHLILSTEDKENYLEHPIPEAHIAPPGQQVLHVAVVAHAAWVKGQKEAHELLQNVREFHACKQEEGQSVSSYVLKMNGYIDNLERLSQPVGQNLAVSLILVSLSKDYDSFVQNYNMHGIGKTVNELHAMLKLHEDTLPKKDANHALHAIRSGRVQKNQKNKPHKAAKGVMVKERARWVMHQTMCHLLPNLRLLHHLRRITLKRKPFATNVGLRESKKLKPCALSLYLGDGHRAAIEAIRTYHLELPSGLVIVLNNYHYVPSITRGVISVSRLFDDDFINRFDENNVILVSKNNLVYFMVVPRDGIFEIDMSCSNTNDSSIKKRIEKLQHDILLNSIDIESLGKCVSCMSGKMARKPYSHQVERAKDLLRLIHTDVCGPFRIMSRQGANYFVTFTDDFSRYSYVYLLKHKHEVFETFKVFQKEVENHLGKTIKSLRSNRKGEYICKEFLDHFKEHGIISHRTPPYTLQHNGVPERRNRTPLDMVRSMMSQTTLPNPSENKVFVARNAEFFENDLIDLKASGSVKDLELIQEEDTNPSLDTSLDHEEDDQEIDEPQSDINPIRKSSRTRRAPDRMCLYINAEEHELGDLGESANYKATLLDPESKKWLDAMNVKMQSMKDNDVWVLVELPPNARTIGSKFAMKDLWDAAYILGIKIYRDKSKRLIGLCQSSYIEKILKRYYMENSQRGTFLMQEKLKLRSIMYVVRCTRLDVVLSRNITSRFQQNPSEEQWTIVKNILKYLRNTKDMFLVYEGNMEQELRVSCYTDAGYLTDADDLKSQTGYVFVLNGGAVNWKSTKQSILQPHLQC